MFTHLHALLDQPPVRIAIALTALVVCWLARAPVRWVLVRAGGWLARRTPSGRDIPLDDLRARIKHIVTVPINYLAVAIGLEVAQHIVPYPLLSAFLARVNFTLFAIIVAMLIGKFINQLLLGSNRRLNLLGITIEPQLMPFVRTFVWAFIIVIALSTILRAWSFDPTALLAGTGLAGLAISLAAKDTADNLLGYFVIIMERPFLIGDYITASNVSGTVEHIGWRSTRIRQMDQVLVTVPNKNLTSANIANAKRLTKQLMETRLRLAYETPPDTVQRLLDALRTLLAARPLVEAASITVLLDSMTTDALEILVRCNILTPDWGEYKHEQEVISLDILRQMEAATLHVALPSQTMYIQPLPTPASNGHLLAEEPAR